MKMSLTLSLVGILNLVSGVVAVAYYTVLERKVLGVIQTRKGPNKTGPLGLGQPWADALKLMIKSPSLPWQSNKLLFIIAPAISMLVSLLAWHLIPSTYNLTHHTYGALMFFMIIAFNIIGSLLSAWASNSKYAMLGAMRLLAQSISYEIVLMALLLTSVLILGTFSWEVADKVTFPVGVLFPSLLLVWWCTLLAECNRAPFDFAEGESELVSGFNVEYSGGLFSLIFLAEYMNMVILSFATVIWWLSNPFSSLGLKLILVIMFCVLFIVVRAAYPRYRYDLLMTTCWNSFLPLSLAYMFFPVLGVIL